jgi:hypothetical protein
VIFHWPALNRVGPARTLDTNDLNRTTDRQKSGNIRCRLPRGAHVVRDRVQARRRSGTLALYFVESLRGSSTQSSIPCASVYFLGRGRRASASETTLRHALSGERSVVDGAGGADVDPHATAREQRAETRRQLELTTRR